MFKLILLSESGEHL